MIEDEALLFVLLPSLLALVVPDIGLVPVVVGVPETVQVIVAPAATLVGVVGEQTDVRPGGKPVILQVAAVAVSAGEAALEHVYVPL